MKVNVENIKVLKVNNNDEIIVFKAEDIVELEYNSIVIKGRLANIDDTQLIIDCSEKYSSKIHEVSIEKITWIQKVEEGIEKSNVIPQIQREEADNEVFLGNEKKIESETLVFNDASLEEIVNSKVESSTIDNKESVSLFGSIKRNYAQGISPILNR